MTMRSHEQKDAFTLPRDAERLGIAPRPVSGASMHGPRCAVRVIPAGRKVLYRLEMDIGPLSFSARRPIRGKGIAWDLAPEVLFAFRDAISGRDAPTPWLLTMLSEDERPL